MTTGQRGEQRAAEFLQRHGYVILARNYRWKHGEIDIICADVRYLVFAGVLALAGTVCWILCGFCQFSALGNVLVKIVVCSVIPNGVFILCFHKTEEFGYLKNSMKQIFTKILRKRGS